MELSRKALGSLKNTKIDTPSYSFETLPEKIIQFGTGVLLRGLPDYFVDKANRQGLFNGRIVVVKSTGGGEFSSFQKQDSLYTICVRGIDDAAEVQEDIISASISRVLEARSDWKAVLDCAASPDIKIVISNTTEVGITYVEESIFGGTPDSFPGKLLALLFERYKTLKGAEGTGLVIVPTELIVDNGPKLKKIVYDLAAFNKLEAGFLNWLEKENQFCSSLVDRIVPGKPSDAIRSSIQEKSGYTDDLMIMAEVYRLWAIQGDEHVRKVLSFAAADPGVIIEPDIDIYRELKLRMLNGTHTLSCGLAVLAGFETVKEAMMDNDMSEFIASLMLDEIASGIPYPLDPGAASAFGKKVLDRFRNPFIEHKWISITMQFSSKMKMRNIPVLLKYFENRDRVPECIALGFAAYILFMRSGKQANGSYTGTVNGSTYPVNDDLAQTLQNHWEQHGATGVVDAVLTDTSLWGTDLSVLPGFEVAVNRYLEELLRSGGRKTLQNFQEQKALAG